MTPPLLRIGTRKSPLALIQAHLVKDQLMQAWPELICEIVPMSTTGDNTWDKPLTDIGGKGLFMKELEEQLVSGGIDIAVHSMKDVPDQLPKGLAITCMLEREDPRDALISHHATSLETLPHNAVIGTCSPRRAVQLKAIRPDIEIVPMRGSVQTRLDKLDKEPIHGTFLAMAGLNRLNIQDAPIAPIDEKTIIPAIGQGAIGIEHREKDTAIAAYLAPLNHADTFTCVSAERQVMKALNGSCQMPLAAHASLDSNDPMTMTLRAMFAQNDHSPYATEHMTGSIEEASRMGIEIGKKLKAT